MTRAKSALAALSFLTLPVSVQAAPLSGQELLAGCTGDATGKAMCDGYLRALTDLVLRREARGKVDGKICLPEVTTIEQVRDAVIGFAGEHPGLKNRPALGLFRGAVQAKWPCAGAEKAQ